MSLPTLITTSVSEQVMSVIREAIMTEQLVPGERYSVEQVADLLQLGVSRTPVREALVRLAGAGLVRFERNRGVRILKPDVHDLEELFQLRLMVEVPAAYRAAQRVNEFVIYQLEGEINAMDRAVKAFQRLSGTDASDEVDVKHRSKDLNAIVNDFIEHDTKFHELVIGAAGNERLVRTVGSWRDVITALGGWRLTQSRSLKTLLLEHKNIFDAFREKRSEATAQAMYYHIRETGNLLMKELHAELPSSGAFDPYWFEGIAMPNMKQFEESNL